MELPSMVERAGDKLVVRSLVSGSAVYQTTLPMDEVAKSQNAIHASASLPQHPLMSAEMLERQLEHYRLSTHSAPSMPPRVAQTFAKPAAPEPVEANEEDLPQCKIRRNYSCNQCAFFTQNPRSHLSHLRDVHGERIVINECKLCLYASRHFQKLVRHMKMVHGCVDDANANGSGSGLAQLRGKRTNNREARKRRLEESVDPANFAKMMQSGPSLDQLKYELQLQEQQLQNNVQAYNRQQDLQQLQRIVLNSDNIFSMAFEFQTHVQNQLQLRRSTATVANINVPEQENSSTDSEASSPPDDSMNLSSSPSTSARRADEPMDLSHARSNSPFRCKKCSYSTPIRARFKKHVKYHSMPLIKCVSCDFHTPYKWNLDRHTKNHGANGIHRCSSCDFSTDIKQSLTIHELNHHVRKVNFQAETCHNDEEPAANPLMGETAQPPGESSESAINTPNSAGATVPELAPIHCSHCRETVPSALDLLQHLQHCPPALRSTSQHIQATVCEMELDFSMQTTEDEVPSSSDLSYYGVETAPGYGEYRQIHYNRSHTSRAIENNSERYPFLQVTEQLMPEDSVALNALKKVFKCPHCTFWAATASRFHVHIVGHLNRKPFECSLCSYRSNWRWDITKHIRLKAMRDKSHTHAEVLMNDETGRRNYAKYNQYLTLMKVNTDIADMKPSRSGDVSINEPIEADKTDHLDKLDANSACFEMDENAQRGLETKAEPDFLQGLDLRVPLKHTEQQEPISFDPKVSTQLASTSINNTAKSQDEKKYSIHSETEEMSSPSPTIDDFQALDLSNPSAGANNEDAQYQTFRCGLCHQMSHWKHVIQRHCRLKHAGAICMEVLVNHTYQPMNSVLAAKEDTEGGPLLPALEPIPIESPQKSDEDKAKVQPESAKCELFDFKGQTKSELRRHRSLHKQNVRKCEQCDFACSGKIKLARHVRHAHINNPTTNAELSTEPSTSSSMPAMVDGVQLSHCPHCPARFLQRTSCDDDINSEMMRHLAGHDLVEGSSRRYSCRYCAYYTDDEAEQRLHLSVHSSFYQSRSQTLFQNYKINDKFPAPLLTQLESDSIGQEQPIWVVINDTLNDVEDVATESVDYDEIFF
ncbi:zinc finger protein 423 [Scaptodrosophila lebanonensis]|uniref:Zinc finger protein 423 n=1 Tax=Drosophila lebanonensis TaxID=7225 RepID=A0A6J2TWQ2_DROLE|nr:zinc finger protein 423 [Scaptodrosophila lebanonensis]